MFLKKDEFEILTQVYDYLPTGEDFEALPEEQRYLITRFDALLVSLNRRRQASNAKTAQYIAEKRKTNRHYAR